MKPDHRQRLDTFDPNKMDCLGEWATFVPNRPKGEFVVHTNRKQALNAITNNTYGKLYKRRAFNWELIATKPLLNAVACMLCGDHSRWRYHAWAKDKSNRIPEVPVLVYRCDHCHQIPLP